MSDATDRLSALATEAWGRRDLGEARAFYEEILSHRLGALDRAKVLANVAQLDVEQGQVAEASDRAKEALDIVYTHQVYLSLEGSHLLGFLRGLIRRLEGNTPGRVERFRSDLPLMMNLGLARRLRAHLSVATIGAGLALMLDPGSRMLQVDVVLPWGILTVWSLTGLLVGWFLTGQMLEGAMALMAWAGPPETRLTWAVNFLTGFAVFVAMAMPLVLNDVALEVTKFLIGGLVAGAFYFIILARRQ